MDKESLLNKIQEHLTPFETGNLIEFIQNFNMQTATDHPLIALLLVILAFYAFIKKSKPLLVLIFATVSIILLVRYTLSPAQLDKGIAVNTALPFIGGGLLIGVALIYLIFFSND